MTSPSEQEPYGVETSMTPSGIEIRFTAGPKRKYELRATGNKVALPDPWRVVPSVTKILEILDKPGLVHWGQTVGVEGVLSLFGNGTLDTHQGLVTYRDIGEYGEIPFSTEDMVSLLKERKLTVSHVKNKAGDRGTGLHTALQTWADHGAMPVPEFAPEEQQGYVRGLCRFLEDSKCFPVFTEVMVGSVEHGYAGRFDLLAAVEGDEWVSHVTAGGRETREKIPKGLYLFDLKTSKKVYDTHYLQLAAYEQAFHEGGWIHEPELSPATLDKSAIIHVRQDGTYQVKTSKATFDDFLAVKNAYDVLEDLRKR